MLGAVAGDIIGSVFEFHAIKSMDFPLFSQDSTWTDDTVLTMAVAQTLLTGRPYEETLREFALEHPDAGFGGMFTQWFTTPGSKPYNGFGNGSAMRVSPVGWAFDTLEETLEEAQRSAEVTHNHPEGIKGAQATAAAIFFARQGTSQIVIRDVLEARFGYNLHRAYEDIQASSSFDETSQRSVPEALICALTSMNFEGAVCRAIALGGDADTQAAIAGSVAEALYGGVPASIAREVRTRLTPQFIGILDAFQEKYRIPHS
ncbi:MAG: ADP-ribosylglycohydrolase family protein [Candidatus Cryosericum sp.]